MASVLEATVSADVRFAGVVYVLIFNYAPMVGLIIGFKDYKITGGLKGMFTSQWVGLKYFKEFLRNINFRS